MCRVILVYMYIFWRHYIYIYYWFYFQQVIIFKISVYGLLFMMRI